MLYFAYGSNMDRTQMLRRCPDASVVSVGSMCGWSFRINARGVATMVEARGSVVWGVVWQLSEEDERSLDMYEGVASGLYKKVTLPVLVSGGTELDALVYIAEEDAPSTPRSGYLESIVVAARMAGLPEEHVEELLTWTSE